MNQRRFGNAVVVVTGAAGGLGRALCLRFAQAGARIAALDRDDAALRGLAAELQVLGCEHLCLPCDVSEAAACEGAMREVVARFGGIDLLVNNAGIAHRSAFAETRPEVIRRVMDVNFFGAVHCTHAALQPLRASRGMVVAISSVAGFSPLVARTGYAASKHALHGFFDSLRTELAGDGVDVLLACPSFIATGIDRAALGGDGQPARHARTTTGAQASPADVADAVFEAASRRRQLLLVGATARLAWWISRLAPGLYATLMRRRLRTEWTASLSH